MRAAFVILLLIFAIDLQCVFQTNFDRVQHHQHVDTACSVNITENVAKRRKVKPLIAKFFANTTRKNPLPAPTESACKWLKNYKTQSRQCLRRRGFSQVLWESRNLAITQCRQLFAFDRWDCTRINNAMFKRINRESAFLQALSASALMFSIAKACSDGKLAGCFCLPKSQGGGCEDNTKIARRITRRFLLENNKEQNDSIAIMNPSQLKRAIYANNINIGLRTVVQHKKDACVCHGLSGSCNVKTCWKRINRNFTVIAISLKSKYNSATKVNNETFQDDKTDEDEIDDKLFYLAYSPNFCNTTRGRRCKDPSHCATLCCGRGFVERPAIALVQCNCTWKNDFVLGCETCRTDEVHFICK